MSDINLNDFLSDSVLKHKGFQELNSTEDITTKILLECDNLEDKLSALNIITSKLPFSIEENLPFLLKHVMPCANTIIDSILENVTTLLNHKDSKENSFRLKSIKKYLMMGHQLIDSVNIVLDYVIQNKVDIVTILHSTPIAVLEILLKVYEHCKNSKDIYNNYFKSLNEIFDLFKKGQDLNSKFIEYMNSQSLFTNFKSENMNIMKKVINLLGKVGEVLSGINTKSMIETWKCHNILFQKYFDTAQSRSISISQPLQFFAKEIKNNMIIVLESDDFESKKVVQSLKVCNFFIKNACWISNLQGNEDSYFEIILFLSTIYCYNPKYINFKNIPDKIDDLIKSSIFKPCELLCQNIFKNGIFHKTLQDIKKLEQSNIKCNLTGYAVLVLSAIDFIHNDNKQLDLFSFNLSNYFKVVFFIINNGDKKIYEDLLTSERFFNLNNIYDSLVINCVILLHFIKSNEAEIILLDEIVSENIENALLATDIWIYFIRSQPPEYGFDLFLTLTEKSLKLFHSLLYTRPESVLFGNFLSQIYNNFPNNFKDSFKEKYPPLNYLYLWKYFTISDVKVINSLVEKFEEKLKELNSGKISVDNFKILINLCDVLSISTMKNVPFDVSPIKNELKKIWTFKTERREILEFPYFTLFLEKLCKITGKLISSFDSVEILQILQQLDALSNQLDILLFILDFILCLSTQNLEKNAKEIISESIKFFIKGLTSTKPIMVQESLEHFELFFKNTSHKQLCYEYLSKNEFSVNKVKLFLQRAIIVDNEKTMEFYENLRKITYNHVCLQRPQDTGHKNKKFKSDLDDEVVSVIERIRKDVNILNQFRRSRCFSDENVANILQISYTIQDILR